jgi:uncharacterized protein YutE (UPF0331/DUF86 family)
VAPEVVLRKLAYMEKLLRDLRPYEGASLAQVESEHYKIERLFELLATTASDLIFHLLAEQGQRPDSYRQAFQMAAAQGMLPSDLGERLAQLAAMRNILVHLYERIDYSILHSSIKPAINDFGDFIAVLSSDRAS